jgi:hypothetical protein
MTRAEQLAYARGYNAGRGDRWPAHKPPMPPEPIIQRLMAALRALRDEADGQCAMFDPDDEMVVALGPHIDEADAALEAVTTWLKEIPCPPSSAPAPAAR